MLFAKDLYLAGFFVLAIFLVVALIRKFSPGKIIFLCCFGAYLFIVAGITLFPIPVRGVSESVPPNLTPFATIRLLLSYGVTPNAVMQIAGNIVMAIPFGFFVKAARYKKNAALLLFYPLLFPVVIEFSQLIIGSMLGGSYRTFDVDDFILNITGVCLGYLLFCILPRRAKLSLSSILRK